MTDTPYSEGFRSGWNYGHAEGLEKAHLAWIKALDEEGFPGIGIGHLMKLAQVNMDKVPARQSQPKSDTP